jgi:hypothetical protein
VCVDWVGGVGVEIIGLRVLGRVGEYEPFLVDLGFGVVR